MSRVAAYQAAAKLAGTAFERADPQVRSNIAGAITRHPIDRDAAAELAVQCRAAGGEAKLVDEYDDGTASAFAYVYLSGCSFNSKDHL